MNDAVEDTDARRVAELRDALVERLIATRQITSAEVEAAFRAVPRHEFAPAGTPLEAIYNPGDSVVTKRDEYGVAVSSISAPFIQARMIEQAELGPGMSALEVGSGGYNAALMAEVVGPNGRVVSVDIDPEVSDRARTLLETTGYGDRVTVVSGDAGHGVPEFGIFDRIIVTVGAPDIPGSWLKQLARDGVIVLPLIMNGVTRSIAFRRQGDHLASTSAEVCGFVPMQGDGAQPEKVLLLPDAQGCHVRLRFNDGGPENPSLLDGVLATERTTVWSGVTIPHGVSFADLHLWFAGFLPGFCKLAADEGTVLAEERKTWFPFGVARGDSFAYLAVRPALEGAGVEFGARAYGPHGQDAATAMVEQIEAWDRRARRGQVPTFAFWPTGSDSDSDQIRARLPEGVAVFTAAHGLITISWPPAG
ncbi:methyltransferase, FxLD system [Acrocarpospora sp. B8E8]|uniref:methyltransferase, FxLD system n=1 Tax=Acrocarpospora sp. B8E8 TaxID=3153572 RepID=UPI00325DC8AE